MKRMTQIFQPIISIPKNAKIKNTEITCRSQKLLMECGMVRPTSSGLFTLLPLARRALDKLEALVQECVEEAGAQRISLPALTAASLWRETGRLETAGPELMRLTDRHHKDYVLAPTHEEAITDVLADVGPLSYKQLPLLLYQISSKYRDEHRPKHGLLRAREFLMLDAYGAHAGAACARAHYRRLSAAYRRLYHALRVTVHRVSASSGEMGGSVSHEWQLPAPAGEDTLHVCPGCARASLQDSVCHACGGPTEPVSSVEVGHTFILGTRYSAPLGASVVPSAGAAEPITMSCYGIGLTRLLAASVDALSTESALRWPRGLAPYSTVVIGPKEGSKEWSCDGLARADAVCAGLAARGRRGDVLLDDRHALTVGKRLMQANRSGYPNIVVCGRATLESPPRYELHQLRAGDPGSQQHLLTLEELFSIMEEETDESDPPLVEDEDEIESCQ